MTIWSIVDTIAADAAQPDTITRLYWRCEARAAGRVVSRAGWKDIVFDPKAPFIPFEVLTADEKLLLALLGDLVAMDGAVILRGEIEAMIERELNAPPPPQSKRPVFAAKADRHAEIAAELNQIAAHEAEIDAKAADIKARRKQLEDELAAL